MTRTAQISREKWQSIITLRHEGQSIWKMSKSSKRYNETGSHEDRHRKGSPRVTSAAADKFIRDNCTSEIAAQINASQSSSNRYISTSTVQRRLRESGLHVQIAAKRPLLKDTNKKKRLAWAKKHEQQTLDWWKSLVWWVQIGGFSFQPLNLCEIRVGEQMISACVIPT